MPKGGLLDGRIQINSLEVFASASCNLRCEHCAASAQYVTKPFFPNLEILERTLFQLARVMRSKQVKVLGGEPLLNKDLPDLFRAIRRTGFCERVRVCTNGVLLDRMSDEFWRHVDVVEVSLYPNASRVPNEEQLTKNRERADRFGTILEINKITHFQKSFVTAPIEDPGQVQKIFDECCEAHVWPCHTLEGSTFLMCSRIHNLERRMMYLGHSDLDLVKDAGIEVSDRGSLLAELVRYMERREPFRACKFCLGTSGKHIENRQLSRDEVKQRRTRLAESFELRLIDFGNRAGPPADHSNDGCET